MIRIFFILLFAAFALPARAQAESLTRARWLMGTLLEVTTFDLDSNTAADPVFDEVDRLERILSTFIEDSELSRLNDAADGAPRPVSTDLWNVLTQSLEVARASGGAFDPTYGSTPKSRGFDRLRLNAKDRTVALAEGAVLNFGAIAKGYALDSAARLIREAGVESALLNFGGQILVIGESPVGDWPVIGASGLTLHVRDRSVSTSGLSQRPGHIRDPRSGAAIKGAGTVTVIARTAAAADAWSTAFFVSGMNPLPSDFDGCAIISSPDNKDARMTVGDCAQYLREEPAL